MPEITKPSEALDAAADIIFRDGWVQGMYYREPQYVPRQTLAESRGAAEKAKRTAPCCQEGAINRAIYGLAWVNSIDRRQLPDTITQISDGARRYMHEHIRETFGAASPIDWNDRTGRTAEEVVQALRDAAVLARSRGE